MRWLTVGPVGQPGTSIVLHPPFADPGITEDERRTIAEMMAKGTYAIILLAAPDLDGVFAHLQASDAEVVQEPTEQPYGLRDCALAIAAGAHPKEIQELCGHASIGTTLNVYGHLLEGLQDRLAERLADTFRTSRAAWMRPERGPDVVEMSRAEMK